MIEIREFETIDFKGYTFVEGFPGLGLVGPMAISYMVQKLDMRYIGFINSQSFPPLITIHKSKPLPAVRIYYSEKHKIVSILAEFTVPFELVNELSDTIYSYLKTKHVSKIVSISGIPSDHVDMEDTFGIASSDALMKELEKAEINTIEEGVSTGVSAMLLKNAITDKQSAPEAIGLLVPVSPSVVDPKYAENAIIAINKLLGTNIDVAELEKEAKEVEAKIRDLMKKSRDTSAGYKKILNPPEDSSMYG